MNPPARAPVRRSALEVSHAALGAAFVSASIRWPVSYGDPAAEAAAVARAAGIAEIGPLDKVVIRGPEADARIAEFAAGADVWQLVPGEAIVVGSDLGELMGRIAGSGLLGVDVSSAYAALRLAGAAALTILEEACALDLDHLEIAQAPLGNVAAIVRRDDDRPTFTILVARDEAEYLWDALLRLGAPHGLRPVGPAAVAPTPMLEAVR